MPDKPNYGCPSQARPYGTDHLGPGNPGEERKTFCSGSRTVRERGLSSQHIDSRCVRLRCRVTLVYTGIEYCPGRAVIDLLLLGQVYAVSMHSTGFLISNKIFYLSVFQCFFNELYLMLG